MYLGDLYQIALPNTWLLVYIMKSIRLEIPLVTIWLMWKITKCFGNYLRMIQFGSEKVEWLAYQIEIKLI